MMADLPSTEKGALGLTAAMVDRVEDEERRREVDLPLRAITQDYDIPT